MEWRTTTETIGVPLFHWLGSECSKKAIMVSRVDLAYLRLG